MSEFLSLVIYLPGRIGGFYLPATALHFFKKKIYFQVRSWSNHFLLKWQK